MRRSRHLGSFGGMKNPYVLYDYLRLQGNPNKPLVNTGLTDGAIYIETSVMCSATPDYFSFVLSKLGGKDPSDQIYTMLGGGFKGDSGTTYGSIDVWKDYNTTGAFGNEIKQVVLGNWYTLAGTFDATNHAISAVFDGSSSSTSSYYVLDNDQPWTLFGIYGRNVHHGAVGIQEFKIWDSSSKATLLMDLVPALRTTDWAIGMVDVKNDTFIWHPCLVNDIVQHNGGSFFSVGNIT